MDGADGGRMPEYREAQVERRVIVYADIEDGLLTVGSLRSMCTGFADNAKVSIEVSDLTTFPVYIDYVNVVVSDA